MFLGGHDTTTRLIALGMSALVRHPDQLALLRDRPDLVAAAVEEMLRYDAPFQMNLRYVTEDVGAAAASSSAPATSSARRSARPTATRSAAIRSGRVPDRPAGRRANSASAWAPTSASARRSPGSRRRSAVETLVRRLPGLRLDPDSDPAPDVRNDITSRMLRTLRLAFDPP